MVLFTGCQIARFSPGGVAGAELASLGSGLRADVEHLAKTIGERNVFRPRGLSAAREWVEGKLRDLPRFDVQLEPVKVVVNLPGPKQPEHTKEAWNVVAEKKGADPVLGREIILIGAHYDSVAYSTDWTGYKLDEIDPGKDGPRGADDNASGVAALLAIGRELSQYTLERTVRLVAFVNEEPPFCQEEETMGSSIHARGCQDRAERIVAMISLETLAVYSFTGEHRKRRFSPVLSLVGLTTEPSYVAFLSHARAGSGACARAWAEEFSRHAGIEVRTVSVPWLPGGRHGLAWSDDWSFTRHGFPAFAVTDTAYMRSDRYHTEKDNDAEITDADYLQFANVVHALGVAIVAKAGPLGPARRLALNKDSGTAAP